MLTPWAFAATRDICSASLAMPAGGNCQAIAKVGASGSAITCQVGQRKSRKADRQREKENRQREKVESVVSSCISMCISPFAIDIDASTLANAAYE